MKMKLKELKKVILKSGLFLSTLLGSLALASQVNAEQFKYVDQNNQEQTLEIAAESTFGQILGESSANFYVINDGDGEKTLAERTLIPDKNAHILDYLQSDKTFKIIDQSQYEALKDTKTLTFRYQDFNHQDHSLELDPVATIKNVLASLPKGTHLYNFVKYLDPDRSIIAELIELFPTKTIKSYLELRHERDNQIIRMLTNLGVTPDDAMPRHTFMLLTEKEREQLEQKDDDLRETNEKVEQQRIIMQHECDEAASCRLAQNLARRRARQSK